MEGRMMIRLASNTNEEYIYIYNKHIINNYNRIINSENNVYGTLPGCL